MNQELPPGWYQNGEGERRYWDGQQWLTPESASVPAVPTEPDETATGDGISVNDDEMLEPASRKRSKTPLLIASGVGAVALAGIASFLLLSPSAAATAEQECTDEVLNSLRSPNTATFSDYEIGMVVERYEYLAAVIFIDLAELLEEDIGGVGASDIIDQLGDGIATADDVDSSAMTDWADSEDGREILITTGYVDSENGFGAVVHSEFVCMYDPDGDGESTKLLTLGDTAVNPDAVTDLTAEFSEYDKG